MDNLLTAITTITTSLLLLLLSSTHTLADTETRGVIEGVYYARCYCMSKAVAGYHADGDSLSQPTQLVCARYYTDKATYDEAGSVCVVTGTHEILGTEFYGLCDSTGFGAHAANCYEPKPNPTATPTP